MLLEALAAALVGVAALWLVLQPVLAPGRELHRPVEPLDPEETPRGIALAALKEIDFDRETGKLSDADYRFLKAKYTTAALDALRAEEVGPSVPNSTGQPSCPTCGPRPEPDAIFCSTCGLLLTASSASETARAAATARPTAAMPPNPLQAS
jgi:hypothetical protein